LDANAEISVSYGSCRQYFGIVRRRCGAPEQVPLLIVLHLKGVDIFDIFT